MYVVGSLFRVLEASLVNVLFARAVDRVEVEGDETLWFKSNAGLTDF